MFELSNYRNVASDIIERAEIPVKGSPLKGATLAALSGVSGASILELFHSGVPLQEACITILFLASTPIIFGAAKGVARAVEEGLEQKVLKLFGVAEHRAAKARAKTKNVATEKATGVRRRSVTMEDTAQSDEAYHGGSATGAGSAPGNAHAA
jgi:hypothetical protein